MSVRDATIDNARALLNAFSANGWSSAVLRIGDNEFSFARDADIAGLTKVRASGATDVQPPPQIAATLLTVTAPHVGTLVELTEVGRDVAKGARVAVVAVLGDTFDVPAPADGRVADLVAKPGSLVEFGEALVRIST